MGFTANNVGVVLNGYVPIGPCILLKDTNGKFRRYEEICPLNSGAFGSVSLARDAQSDTLVAIKAVKKPDGEKNPHGMDEVRQELEYHTQLGSHPNIVNLLDSFETDSHFYLVMEYCADGDLYDAIDNGRGPSDHLEIKAFILQLLSAVEHMHSNGIYHRDIKPENVFLTEDGTIKLGDFGLATRKAVTDECNVGSERYMAPEQINCGASGVYSPEKADIWALGICLLNVLFHKAPFTVADEQDVSFRDFVACPESLYDMFPTMSEETFNALQYALALDPAKRSLSMFRDALFDVKNWTTDDEDDLFADDWAHEQVVEDLYEPSPAYTTFNKPTAISWTDKLAGTPATAPISTPTPTYNRPRFDYFDTVDIHPPSNDDKWKKESAYVPSSVDSGIGMSIPDSFTKTASRTNLRDMIPQAPVKFTSTSWSDLVDEEEEEEEQRERELAQKRLSFSFEADDVPTFDDSLDTVCGWEMTE